MSSRMQTREAGPSARSPGPDHPAGDSADGSAQPSTAGSAPGPAYFQAVTDPRGSKKGLEPHPQRTLLPWHCPASSSEQSGGRGCRGQGQSAGLRRCVECSTLPDGVAPSTVGVTTAPPEDEDGKEDDLLFSVPIIREDVLLVKMQPTQSWAPWQREWGVALPQHHG